MKFRDLAIAFALSVTASGAVANDIAAEPFESIQVAVVSAANNPGYKERMTHASNCSKPWVNPEYMKIATFSAFRKK